MKRISNIFGALAIILANVMCAVVAFRYADMICGVAHRGYSAPSHVAFLYAIPYVIGIAACVIVALILRKWGK